MVPVRYVANALGVDSENIIWNKLDRTVTVFKDNRVVQLTIDSPLLTINGAKVTMDTTAIIKDGRTILPISWVAKGLNVPYTWDEVAKTVTFETTK